MKRVVCKRCGVEHDCAGRMSPHEAAMKRWRGPEFIVAASESCATGRHGWCEMKVECLCPCHAAAHAAAAKSDV